MLVSLRPLILLAALAARRVLAAEYILSDRVIGSDFNLFFNYEAIPDPTHGRVNYTDMETAIANNLTSYTRHSFILRTDNKTVLSPDGPGRNSVRLISKKSYKTHTVIFKMRHMPTGCATWPAVWETDPAPDSWPNGGEVDIIEGVNENTENQSTLHTSPGCSMPDADEISMTGTQLQQDCDVNVNYNAGCGVRNDDDDNYGASFNAAGGGWYAMERTNHYIKMWFWSAQSDCVPLDVLTGSPFVATEFWGEPYAFFPNTDCNFKKFFSWNAIIINLTLCGDWAGNVYSSSECPSTCVDFVNNNPEAFSEAYFDFESIHVYESPFSGLVVQGNNGNPSFNT